MKGFYQIENAERLSRKFKKENNNIFDVRGLSIFG